MFILDAATKSYSTLCYDFCILKNFNDISGISHFADTTMQHVFNFKT